MPTIHDDIKDLSLNGIKNGCDKMVVLDADPLGVYADTQTNNGTGDGKRIAEVAMLATDFTVADAELGTGRQVKSAAKTSLSAVAAGDAAFVAWIDTGNSKVLMVTPLATTRVGISVSDPLDVPAIIYDIPDAVEAT